MFSASGWALAEITTNIAGPDLFLAAYPNLWVAVLLGEKTPEATSAGNPGLYWHPSLAWLACVALACLAILASYRHRSPCLHQQQRPRRATSAAGVIVVWCRQGKRGRDEAMEAKQAKASQASRARTGWDNVT